MRKKILRILSQEDRTLSTRCRSKLSIYNQNKTMNSFIQRHTWNRRQKFKQPRAAVAVAVILFLGDSDVEAEYVNVMKVLPKNHDVRTYDKSLPLGPQIADAEIIIEDGGTRITREFVDAAK